MPFTTPTGMRPAAEQEPRVRTQAASALPFFLFALPAGAIGDIVDRRKLVLYTEFSAAG